MTLPNDVGSDVTEPEIADNLKIRNGKIKWEVKFCLTGVVSDRLNTEIKLIQ